jgi:hypothetical protein
MPFSRASLSSVVLSRAEGGARSAERHFQTRVGVATRKPEGFTYTRPHFSLVITTSTIHNVD